MISVLLLRCLFGTFNALVMHLVTNNHELDAYVLSLIFRRWIHLGYDEDGTMSYDSDSLLYSDALQFLLTCSDLYSCRKQLSRIFHQQLGVISKV